MHACMSVCVFGEALFLRLCRYSGVRALVLGKVVLIKLCVCACVCIHLYVCVFRYGERSFY